MTKLVGALCRLITWATLARLSHAVPLGFRPRMAAPELAGSPIAELAPRAGAGWAVKLSSVCSRFELPNVRRRLIWRKIGLFKAQTCVCKRAYHLRLGVDATSHGGLVGLG